LTNTSQNYDKSYKSMTKNNDLFKFHPKMII
jgi:hypothetical protein